LCEKGRVAVVDQTWEPWLERVYNLQRNKSGSHERPHKPVLLLSIIDLLDRGVIRENAIPLSDELVACFKRYFVVVKREDDKPTIQYPFFHLSSDGFWKLVQMPGEEPIYRPGATSGALTVAELRSRVIYGQFEDGFWLLIPRGQSRLLEGANEARGVISA